MEAPTEMVEALLLELPDPSQALSKALDEALWETFPASDPITFNQID